MVSCLTLKGCHTVEESDPCKVMGETGGRSQLPWNIVEPTQKRKYLDLILEVKSGFFHVQKKGHSILHRGNR